MPDRLPPWLAVRGGIEHDDCKTRGVKLQARQIVRTVRTVAGVPYDDARLTLMRRFLKFIEGVDLLEHKVVVQAWPDLRPKRLILSY